MASTPIFALGAFTASTLAIQLHSLSNEMQESCVKAMHIFINTLETKTSIFEALKTSDAMMSRLTQKVCNEAATTSYMFYASLGTACAFSVLFILSLKSLKRNETPF